MSKKIAAALLAVLMLALSVGVASARNDSEKNKPGYWGSDCHKVEVRDGYGSSWVADDDYALVVLKFATKRFVYEDVKKGDVLTTNGQDISHIIKCGKVTTSTTTTTTSTTTQPPSTTSTSTTTVPESTTTTTVPESTTTTIPLPPCLEEGEEDPRPQPKEGEPALSAIPRCGTPKFTG